jgi:hypothetical protein
MPPPELHFAKWHASLERLGKLKFARIAPTHFGPFDDPAWHLAEAARQLTAAENWMTQAMQSGPTVEQLRDEFAGWMNEQGQAQGLSPEVLSAYALANPPGMSADGLMRYWKKVLGRS